MNILFMCKHNRFRSRVASSYFNKINKNKVYLSKGVGIYPDNFPLDKDEVRVSKELGVDIIGKPKKLDNKLLKWQDKIIIVADDVSKNKIKGNKRYNIEVWKIRDVDNAKDVKKAIKITVKKIMKQVEKLVKELK